MNLYDLLITRMGCSFLFCVEDLPFRGLPDHMVRCSRYVEIFSGISGANVTLGIPRLREIIQTASRTCQQRVFT